MALTMGILIIFLGVYLQWLFSCYQGVWKHIEKFAGPRAWPIFGNLLQVGTTPVENFRIVRRWFKEYKYDCFRIWGGSTPYVFIMNPKHVEVLLSSNHLTYKEDVYNFIRPWLGNGLLTSNGDYWAKHRKMITPSFHFNILQDFMHIINDTTDRFMALLETFSQKEETFDLQEVVPRCTVDVICESAMGTRVNSIEGQESPMVKAIENLCYIIQTRIFSAVKRPNLLFYMTRDYRIQQRSLKVLREELVKIIESRREILKTMDSNVNVSEFKRPKKAFLDNLLTAEVDGRPLTFQEVFEEVSTFMFEGHDTTASSITFTTFCLSRFPELQQKAFNEQFELFGNDLTRSPTYKELNDMKYLELIIKESLRLFPSVPVIVRTTTELTELDHLVIPKGTSIVVPLFGVHISDKNFENPYEFRPERFTAEARANANPFGYVPFSAGARNCVGQKFAMMELKICLSKIIRNFHVLPAVDGLPSRIYGCDEDPPSPYDPHLVFMLTLKSANGVHVRLRKRVY